ncbi:membrane protease FtsH catalytic subunit [Desulfobotulus alkaliphilus]|uniref:ATP-dependent zinc metalloprotease FtsH n=1 Tax=Desulfobotulus alkaliphilus TaxID=622671 RepID=A0A562RGC1_9BACT|nr:ATP-dependent zinc metalloprotease FtsH [Desulfobotulus alkaliphilus]TWI68119.1 membrane protease FtsH catalytic subunit [Desulfobotulus alkaliphilus]
MNPFYKNLSLWLVIILMMIMLYNIFNQPQYAEESIGYSEFLAMVDRDQVSNVTIQGNDLLVVTPTNQRFKVYAPDDTELIPMLRTKGVAIKARPPAESPWFLTVLVSWLPMLLLIGVWIFFMRQMQGGGGKAMSFGKSKARLMDENTTRVTFVDVAGVEEAKEELEEIVDFLKDPKKFTRLGGRIPKGVLLTGSPGTGKTLLARAVAGEAGVPFFSISGSDFVEMFVGVGASRVRDLFNQGKKNAPCIIFIDEIDAVGRQRGAGLGGGHDEREQTLNQMLVEMDGFESNEGVILIAATNRPDVLDPALLRPGRFDRQVVVPLPDIAGREAILRVHMKKSPIGKDVNIKVLAKGTPGFSGADLENMVNEAALIAAKRDKDFLDMKDFEDAKDKVYMGLERKSNVMSEEEKKVTAYHEAGHALVARLLPFTDPVNKITIIPRGRAAGITWFLPDESVFRYKDQLISGLSVAFGGRAAEEIIFKRISTGASNDIKQATDVAQRMVRSWGMSDDLGPISYAKGDEQIFLGRDIGQNRDYSDETARKIDYEISSLIHNAYQNALEVLKDNLEILHKLSAMLLDKETVSGKELDDLILTIRPDIIFPSHLPEMDEDDNLYDAPERKGPENYTGQGKDGISPDSGDENQDDKQDGNDSPEPEEPGQQEEDRDKKQDDDTRS